MFNLQLVQDRREAQKRMGSPYQLAGTRHYQLLNGYSGGTRAIDVKTGSGLEYTVVADRGLDISLASYKGTNITYFTRNEEVHPSYYDSRGAEWLRTFFAGLLTTCGPTHLGPPCVDEGEELGLHGRYSSIPAKNVCDLSSFDKGELKITGIIEDCAPFASKIQVERSIQSPIGESVILIEDTIRNIGSKDSPLTLLYHINFGYPLLSEHSEVFVQSTQFHAYDEYSQQHIDEIYSFRKPSGDNFEKNYWHIFDQEKKSVYAVIMNRSLMDGLGVYIKFDPEILPYLTHWKLEDELDYVLALEPSNTFCYSRSELREKGFLPVIKPHEEIKMRVEIGILDGNHKIDKLLKSIGGI
jgi:hypothetical protein